MPKPGILHSRIQAGFTIVELLIVIVVIGILAAITIIAFNGVQGRANDASVQADLKNIATALQSFAATEGAYPTSTQVYNSTMSVQVNKSAYSLATTNGRNLGFCVVTSPGDQRFVLSGVSKSGNRYSYSSQSGLKQYTNSPPGNSNELCAVGGIVSTEIGAWAGWGSEAGQTNGWSNWVKG